MDRGKISESGKIVYKQSDQAEEQDKEKKWEKITKQINGFRKEIWLKLH